MPRLMSLITWDAHRAAVRVMAPDTSHERSWLSAPLTCPHQQGHYCRWECTHVVIEERETGYCLLCGVSRAYIGRLDDELTDLDLIAALRAATDLDAHRAATKKETL